MMGVRIGHQYGFYLKHDGLSREVVIRRRADSSGFILVQKKLPAAVYERVSSLALAFGMQDHVVSWLGLTNCFLQVLDSCREEINLANMKKNMTDAELFRNLFSVDLSNVSSDNSEWISMLADWCYCQDVCLCWL